MIPFSLGHEGLHVLIPAKVCFVGEQVSFCWELSYWGVCLGVHSFSSVVPTHSGTRAAGERFSKTQSLVVSWLLFNLCFSALPSCLAKTVSTEECLVSPASMNRYGLDPSSPTFSHRSSLPTSSSLYCKRQNSGDGHLGGGSATTVGGPRTSPTSSGGPSAPGLRPPGSSPKRNGTSLEGNRCGNVTFGLASPWPDLLCPCSETTKYRETEDCGCLNVGTQGS